MVVPVVLLTTTVTFRMRPSLVIARSGDALHHLPRGQGQRRDRRRRVAVAIPAAGLPPTVGPMSSSRYPLRLLTTSIGQFEPCYLPWGWETLKSTPLLSDSRYRIFGCEIP